MDLKSILSVVEEKIKKQPNYRNCSKWNIERQEIDNIKERLKTDNIKDRIKKV